MEADEIQCKFPRISDDANGRLGNSEKMDEEDEGDSRRGSGGSGGVGRFYGWPSSRIVRVSRASGGKDRHSKVLTSRGLRDRRVRLSVNTAIQFYDLQDRLGYDQPSKAVEWLLKAAASSISELPPMNSPFPDTPKQLSDEKRSSTGGSDHLGFDSAEVNMNDDGGGGGGGCGGGGDLSYSQQQVTKSSACSSTSETSKGSGLSLSRSESRLKARERAKERAAEKEKEKESEPSLNTISQTTSFTELLNGGINNVSHTVGNTNAGGGSNESNFFLRSPRQWPPMDYFNSGLLGQPAAVSPLFNVTGEHHPELLQFSFVPDHLVVPVVGGNSGGNNGEYNLNFTISSSGNHHQSSLAGFNRGTLQSNSSSSLSPQSFFIGAADNNHNTFLPYDARLQLCYGGDGSNGNKHHSGQKGKGKN